MNSMDSIGKLIEESSADRFEIILDNERFQVRKDTQNDVFYCLNKRIVPAVWQVVEYVAAMQKDAWDNWQFASARDEDEFTDAIAFCEVSGEVVHDGKAWIAWFDICDPK